MCSPTELWSAALTGAGVSSVFRYSYGTHHALIDTNSLELITTAPGAVFADLQKFPGAGAWHSSESAWGLLPHSMALIGASWGVASRSAVWHLQQINCNARGSSLVRYLSDGDRELHQGSDGVPRAQLAEICAGPTGGEAREARVQRQRRAG
jgi:hypothetical protein